ncbi:hypothetical protein CHY_0827 [Carboxydothermus hydrogenoformans Z-2901]|uniref:Uncharacterized protein n=1 Tax=Carboxydothermus hydrogenoformans (strain ATCC BAA-161 / DSM 6008 / Z-2901) TaxID=246194 RepID=Q3ADV3_CARHZ|nr:hypothetical protein CHY_0827 [Carboxydothermus hydrogenoformans Z-2901]
MAARKNFSTEETLAIIAEAEKLFCYQNCSVPQIWDCQKHH